MSTNKKERNRTRRRGSSEEEAVEIEQIEIDFLMLADWAETINGKVYIQGGGWDRKLPAPEGQAFSFAIAAGILVPWHLTNQQHQFSVSIETGDGNIIPPEITGGFNMGRPALSLPGQKFRVSLAAQITTKSPGLGAYRIRIVVNNKIVKYTSFYVVERL